MRKYFLLVAICLTACGGGTVDTTSAPEAADAASCPAQYVDSDGDGYGARDVVPVISCATLEGYSFTHDDCADEEPAAHPGSTDFFDTPIPGELASGTAAYDYNCDGKEERRPGPLVSQIDSSYPCDAIGCR